MGRRPVVAAISIFVHAFVLVALMTGDLWRPISEWPTPRSAMAFVEERPRVHLEDIEVPKSSHPPAARPTPAGPASRTSEVAPIAAPDSITREPELVEIGGLGPIVSGPLVEGFRNIGSPTAPVAPPQPPAPAQEPVRLHSGIRAPQRVAYVTPAYPAIARSAHVEGMVIIEATIDERGNVVGTQVLRSIPLLDAAALDAVRQWKFSPTLLNGVAVPIVMTVTVNFTLN